VYKCNVKKFLITNVKHSDNEKVEIKSSKFWAMEKQHGCLVQKHSQIKTISRS